MVCAVAGSTAPVRYCTLCPGHAAWLSSLLAACSNAATTTLSPFHDLVMALGVALVAFRRRICGAAGCSSVWCWQWLCRHQLSCSKSKGLLARVS